MAATMTSKLLATSTYVLLNATADESGFVGGLFASIVRASGQETTQIFGARAWPLNSDDYELALLRSTGQGCSFPSAISRLISWLGLHGVDVGSPHTRLAVTNNDIILMVRRTVAELGKKVGKIQLSLHPFFNSWVNISDHLANTFVSRATVSTERAVQELKFYTERFAEFLSNLRKSVVSPPPASEAETETKAATRVDEEPELRTRSKDFWSQIATALPSTGEKKALSQSSKKKKPVKTVKKPVKMVKKPVQQSPKTLERSEIVKRLQKVLMQSRKIAQQTNVYTIAKANAKKWTAAAHQACFDHPVGTRVATVVRVVDCGWSQALHDAVVERGQVFTVVCPLRWRGTTTPTADFSTFTDMDFDLSRRTTFNLGAEFESLQRIGDIHAENGMFPVRMKHVALFKPFTKTFSAALVPAKQYLPLNVMPCVSPSAKVGEEDEARRRLWSIFSTASENNLSSLLIPVDYATRSLPAGNVASLCKTFILNDFADAFNTVVFFRAGSDKKVVRAFKEVLTPTVCKYDGSCHLDRVKHWQTRAHYKQLVPFLREPEPEPEPEPEHVVSASVLAYCQDVKDAKDTFECTLEWVHTTASW